MTYPVRTMIRTNNGLDFNGAVLGGDFSPSLVARGRLQNIAIGFVLNKNISFFNSSVGFVAGGIAEQLRVTYADIEHVRVKLPDRPFSEKLSDAVKGVDAGVSEVHVASIEVQVKLVESGSLSQKTRKLSKMVPFIVGRERTANPLLVWNDQFNREHYAGLKISDLKAALDGELEKIVFEIPRSVVVAYKRDLKEFNLSVWLEAFQQEFVTSKVAQAPRRSWRVTDVPGVTVS